MSQIPANQTKYSYFGPRSVGYWLMPFINQAQAETLVGYDIIVLHNEIIYAKSPWIDYLLKKNSKLIILAYFNPPEWFSPAYENCPWAIKITNELKQGEREKWWLKQPNGDKVSFWTGADGRKTAVMDMRDNAPLVDGETYYEFIAKRFVTDILSDKRIKGMEDDNAWPNIFWMGQWVDGNHGLDFNRDKKADKNEAEINANWKSGQAKFIELMRKIKGDDFIIIANPGTLDFNFSINGKIFEGFPFRYAGDTLNDAWNINMSNAAKTGTFSVLQARPGNWFFTYCSALLLDSVCFADVQNAAYRSEFKICLGRALEAPPSNFKKNLPVFSRKYEGGTVYVNPKKKEAWIEDKQGDTLYNTAGKLLAISSH
ncbi:MAG: hypothetical protein WC467_01595 [Patescibacteria group bacterium]